MTAVSRVDSFFCNVIRRRKVYIRIDHSCVVERCCSLPFLFGLWFSRCLQPPNVYCLRINTGWMSNVNLLSRLATDKLCQWYGASRTYVSEIVTEFMAPSDIQRVWYYVWCVAGLTTIAGAIRNSSVACMCVGVEFFISFKWKSIGLSAATSVHIAWWKQFATSCTYISVVISLRRREMIGKLIRHSFELYLIV